ncbi:MAG: zf-HC2 domain-containing protein [Gemmatimonadota bacterium]
MGHAWEGLHPPPETVAAYLDRAVSDTERREIEAHLAECPACLDATVSASGTVGAWRGRRRRRIYVPAAAAAVLAGVLAVGLGVGGGDRSEAEGSRLRAPESVLQQGESLPAVEAVRPPDGGELPSRELTFVWRAVEPGALYRLTLTDAGGDVLWRGNTRDTVLSLTSEILLTPGAEFFWYVDALLESGTSATSGIRSFQATRLP